MIETGDQRGHSKFTRWVKDYLLWMIDKGYSPHTIKSHQRMLNHFEGFVRLKMVPPEQAFTKKFLDEFFDHCRLTRARAAVNGFTRYLTGKGIITIRSPAPPELPEPFTEYLTYYERTTSTSLRHQKRIRKILTDAHKFLEKEEIDLANVKIEEIDRFLREANQGLATRTCKEKESIIRGFLRYLYHEHRLLTRDISALLISAPVFNRDNPPKYLRPDEIRRLFEAVSFSSARDLRTHAIVRLAYTTGLRPLEIARITLDDISFKNGELSVPMRKGYNPVIFPLPDDSIKAIVAYILGARPETDERVLILGLEPPIRPISVYAVGNSIRCLMKKAGVPGAPYWLRHTYAQNLLESGASIFEIKEMLGHESIKTTKRYLHIHIKLMREVLLDD